jgi:hypothetical protein
MVLRFRSSAWAAEESAATERAVTSKRAVKEVFMVRTTASVMELKSALL